MSERLDRLRLVGCFRTARQSLAEQLQAKHLRRLCAPEAFTRDGFFHAQITVIKFNRVVERQCKQAANGIIYQFVNELLNQFWPYARARCVVDNDPVVVVRLQSRVNRFKPIRDCLAA